jgi:peptidoglycan/LPS O-acetylase OafA/YrhL
VATLSNPSVLSVIGPLGLLAVVRRARERRRWLQRSVYAAVTCLVVCSPWIARNMRVFHKPVFLRDGFWAEFYAGNNGDTFESNPGWTHPASNAHQMDLYQSMGELAYMDQKKALALDFVTHHPAFFAAATVRRVVCFWTSFWSLRKDYVEQEPTAIPDFFFCTTMTLLMLRGLQRWRRWDKRSAMPYLLAVLVFPLAYYITHTSPDYRQPIEPVIVMLGTVGVVGTGQSLDTEDEDESEFVSEEDVVLV